MVDFLRYYDHLVELMSTNEELKKSMRGITKQTLWSAGGTITGGVVGGPVGALAGGLLGAAVGYMTSDDYQALMNVLQKLTDDEKEELVRRVKRLVGSELLNELTRWIGISANHRLLVDLLQSFLANK
ncbi:protein C19orf12 homolog [Ptychodera flava]|uniref:protein C19orf12 homolog n=1 Tax=Ptychodera flava TaxID=63121 RepID=UPI003969EE16